MSSKSSNGVFETFDHDRHPHRLQTRRSSSCLGQGERHGEEVLPPTLGVLRALTSALASWVTAEGIIGNLDDLKASEKKW